jgi:hypothetical protein
MLVVGHVLNHQAGVHRSFLLLAPALHCTDVTIVVGQLLCMEFYEDL